MTRRFPLFLVFPLVPFAMSAAGCDAAGRARSDAHHMEMERRMLVLEGRVDDLEAENRVLRARLESLSSSGTAPGSGIGASSSSARITARCKGTGKLGVYAFKRSDVEDVRNNLSALSREARVVPYFENGTSKGFKLFAIRPDSIYGSCGVVNGDVVAKVNGMDLTNPEQALEVYSKMREASAIDLDLIRQGKPVRLRIELTES